MFLIKTNQIKKLYGTEAPTKIFFLLFYGVYEEMQAREAFKGQPKSALKKEFSYKESFYTDIQVVHYILWEK